MWHVVAVSVADVSIYQRVWSSGSHGGVARMAICTFMYLDSCSVTPVTHISREQWKAQTYWQVIPE